MTIGWILFELQIVKVKGRPLAGSPTSTQITLIYLCDNNISRERLHVIFSTIFFRVQRYCCNFQRMQIHVQVSVSGRSWQIAYFINHMRVRTETENYGTLDWGSILIAAVSVLGYDSRALFKKVYIYVTSLHSINLFCLQNHSVFINVGGRVVGTP